MIRLANAWERSGGRAVLVDVGKFPQHDREVDKISDRVPLLRATDLSFERDASGNTTSILYTPRSGGRTNSSRIL